MASRAAATRRRFLETAAAAGLFPFTRARSQAPPASSHAGGVTLPFVGEGLFPVGQTIGAGLGRRRAFDLSSLTAESLVVAEDRFFIRTGPPSRLPPETSWKVRIHGLVEKPLEIGLAELRREAAPQGLHLIECAGNARAAQFGFVSAAAWTGVPLARLLERVAMRRGATQVLVSGIDEHAVSDPGSVPGASWIFDMDQLREAGAFLATAMNGASLSPDHGYPLRLVVPGWYGCTAIKWVDEIALLDDTAEATAQMREFAGRTHQPLTGPNDELRAQLGQRPEGPALARDFQPATIDPAALPIRVERIANHGGPVAYRVVGVHWGGRTEARALRIRFHPEREAARVEQIEPRDGRPWALWFHTWRPRSPGRYRIELAVRQPDVRTLRLDAGFYAREVEITGA